MILYTCTDSERPTLIADDSEGAESDTVQHEFYLLLLHIINYFRYDRARERERERESPCIKNIVLPIKFYFVF